MLAIYFSLNREKALTRPLALESNILALLGGYLQLLLV